MITPQNYLKKMTEAIQPKRENEDRVLTIEDFLQDVEFIAPEGFTVDYFIITPEGMEELQDQASDELKENLGFPENPVSEATVMVKKDLQDRQVDLNSSSSATSFIVPALNNGGPKATRTTDDSIFTQGGVIPSISAPFKKEEEEQTVILRESTKVFPKGTKIHMRG